MNKKIFTGLVILMGISILGIIAVQLIWMNNAIRVKNELFDRSVNDALNNTVDRLESIDDITFFSKIAFGDSIDWTENFDEDFDFTFSPRNLPRVQLPDSLPKPRHPMRVILNKNNNNKATIKIDVETDDENINYNYEYHFDTEKGDSVKIEKSNVIVVDIDSVFNRRLEHIDSIAIKLESTGVSIPELTSRAISRTNKARRTTDQFFNEIAASDDREINMEQIEEFLTDELQNRNIPIDYKYGVLHDSIFLTSVNPADSIDILNSSLQVNLYPNDILQKNIKLAVIFPDHDKFIYRSLSWLLMASFLFSLIILLTFSFSIYYILKQKKISEMKSDFINNMTHEFKTPIATISVAIDSIVNEKVVGNPEKIKYFARMIKKENTRMNRQVEDILTIARLDKKEFEFNWEAMNIHELIDDAIQGINIQVEKRNGVINKKFNAVNAVATTDKMHFTNVIFNLLDNAIKYSVDSPKIMVTTLNKSNGVLISVTDSGIGMTKIVQSKIFERFYRQSSGNIHNVKGFGLGLSYVKAVVEANQGNISVQSEPGKGSKFDVFLPFVKE